MGFFSFAATHTNLFWHLLVKLCHAHACLQSPLLRHMGRCYAALQCHTLKSIIVAHERLNRHLEGFNILWQHDNIRNRCLVLLSIVIHLHHIWRQTKANISVGRATTRPNRHNAKARSLGGAPFRRLKSQWGILASKSDHSPGNDSGFQTDHCVNCILGPR